jgi:hypothetical protein
MLRFLGLVIGTGWIALGSERTVLAAETGRRLPHSGAPDGSAMICLDDGKMFISACDEDNILRWYRTGQPGAPIRKFDLSPFMGDTAESDIEGAARIGRRLYWIASHGTNKKGEAAAARRVFFAVDLEADGSSVRPVGQPYGRLVEDLAAHEEFARLRIDRAALVAPKEKGGLSIEGLAATPEGGLLIGFRNPVPDGLALAVTLSNPDEVVAGHPARFGQTYRLDLGGLGIRGMDRGSGQFWIIAGSIDGDGPSSRLFQWSGQTTNTPHFVSSVSFKGFNPEAIEYRDDGPGKRGLLILSDDGAVQKKKSGKAGFRSLWIPL